MAEVGYSQATIREIARAADMTSASLYNYFPNKSELIKATIAARAEAAMPRLRKAAQGPATSSSGSKQCSTNVAN
ncbi:bacterial regulatory s, tetR family protein [Mycobacterium kansasii]|uniref:Bacterial regulatory s, tetR family protein n=1 Tax=Mycobacterium kansasii TaxID=1768 RepID=A0A1V3XCQ4_MYCKA|nr:bacterial regulatory s, tetR family protein [Mycobacterium kansasii]